MNGIKICKILSPFFFLLIWYAVSAIIAAPLILPFPHQVIQRLFELSVTTVFWKAFAFTFLRVIISFLISLIMGFFLGLIAADSKVFSAFIDFPLELIRATPVIALILPALFWFTSDVVPVFVSVLMCLPIVITSAKKGFEKNPENLEKLFKAKSRNFTGLKAFWYIRLPAATPALLSGAESAFGLSWKVVAAGEVLSIPHYALGSVMQLAQVHLETTDVLAVTFALVLISYVCQHLFVIARSQRRRSIPIKRYSKNHKKTL